MPRTGRIVLPNYPHHVVQRGHNRQVVFTAEQDYQRYVDCLRKHQASTGYTSVFAPPQNHQFTADRRKNKTHSHSHPWL